MNKKKYTIGYFLVRVGTERYGDMHGVSEWHVFNKIDSNIYYTLEEAEKEARNIGFKLIYIQECKIDEKGNVTPRGTIHKIKYNK